MVNSRDISDLHPTLERGAEELMRRIPNILITQTYRDNEYQDYLYSLGRTAEGDIVTNAKGGTSMHNYGLAFDFAKNVEGHEYDDPEFFKTVADEWVKMGGTAGYYFTSFQDRPHLEYKNGLSYDEIYYQGKTLPQDAKMKWEEGTEGGDEMVFNRLSDIKNSRYGTEGYNIAKVYVDSGQIKGDGHGNLGIFESWLWGKIVESR